MSTISTRLLYVPIDNFGDAINPWLWRQLLQDLEFDPCPLYTDKLNTGCNICSIGSFLSTKFLSRFDSAHRLVIAGSGAGYGQSDHFYTLGRRFPRGSRPKRGSNQIEFDPDAITIAWVRGPLTAQRMGIEPDAAIADAAYLLRLVNHAGNEIETRRGIAFMPHVSSADLVPWQRVCDELGWVYIDPRSDRDTVLKAIASAELLVAEALHGAITADALRTPWVAVQCSGEILDFKWQDHCESISVSYEPIRLRTPWRVSGVAYTQRHPLKRFAFGARAIIANAGRSFASIVQQMRNAALAKPYLSDEATISRIDERLRTQIERVRALVGRGN